MYERKNITSSQAKGRNGEPPVKKIEGNRKEGDLGQVRQSWQYNGIKEFNEEYGDPVEFGCAYFHVSRSAYYAWLSGKLSKRGKENQQIAEKVEQIHMQHPDKGYRRIRDDLEHDFGINVNDKRVLRICRAKKIKSTIKYRNHGSTRNAANPQYVAENVLSRNFHVPRPNVKWLTDVTEFKWCEEFTKSI